MCLSKEIIKLFAISNKLLFIFNNEKHTKILLQNLIFVYLLTPQKVW